MALFYPVVPVCYSIHMHNIFLTSRGPETVKLSNRREELVGATRDGSGLLVEENSEC